MVKLAPKPILNNETICSKTPIGLEVKRICTGKSLVSKPGRGPRHPWVKGQDAGERSEVRFPFLNALRIE